MNYFDYIPLSTLSGESHAPRSYYLARKTSIFGNLSTADNMSTSTLPLPRRIVVSNAILSAELSVIPNAEPAVHVISEEIKPISLLEGQAAQCPIFTHATVPTSNNRPYVNPQLADVSTLLPHQGANIQFNDLGPGAKVPMHRTTSTDYIVFFMGEIVLITPEEGYDPKTGRGKVSEVICRAGDVVMQRGTLHAWENRTTEWVRFLGVGLRAEPNTVEVEGHDTRKVLEDCFDI